MGLPISTSTADGGMGVNVAVGVGVGSAGFSVGVAVNVLVGSGSTVFEGACSAYFGPVGTLGGISQTVSGLIVGAAYDVEFAFKSDAGTPSEQQVQFGTATLLNFINPAAGPIQMYSMLHVAAATSESLVFLFRDDPGFLYLDAVSVTRDAV